MLLKHLLSPLVLMLFIVAPAFGQEVPAPSPPRERAEDGAAEQEVNRKALSLLEDVIKDSELFRLVENRLRVRAAAANVLWEKDPERARLLFKEVVAGLADLLNNQEDGEQAPAGVLLQGPRQLRRELLQTLAQRDPRLARELLRSTRTPNAEERVQRGDALADRPLELALAAQLAESDPNQALEIAEETLAGGLSYELLGVIAALQVKDPVVASKLAAQIVVRLRSEKLGESEIARSVAVSLLRLATDTPDEEVKTPKSTRPLLDPQAMSELIDKLVVEALRPNTTSPELLGALQEMMPALEKYAPARAAQVKRKTERAGGTGEDAKAVATGEVDWDKYRVIFEKGNTDEMLAAAASAPESVRDLLYQGIAAKLTEQGEGARARQIINDHVKDPVQRKQMLAELEEAAAYAAAQQGNVEQTRKLIASLRNNEERVQALVKLAEAAFEKGDKGLAAALLDEARELTSGRAKNVKQLLAQLALARAYAPLDASRSLAILEPAVDQLNELLAAGFLLGSFFIEELVQDDEIRMEPLMQASSMIFQLYMVNVNTLARADFERTRELADRFQRPEIRTLARLLLVQSVLMPQVATTGTSSAVLMGVGIQ